MKLLSGSADATARIWDVSCGKELKSYSTSTAVRSVSFAVGDKMVLLATDAKMGHSSQLIILPSEMTSFSLIFYFRADKGNYR